MLPGFDPSNGPALPRSWAPHLELPLDQSLPGLGTLRAMGLAGAIPQLGLAEGLVEFRLCNHVLGSRATFEARAGERRFAVKFYADDLAPEAKLYQKLARTGLARGFGARVPRLLAWEPELRMLVVEWLDGPTAHRLVKQGHGMRAGQLAAHWLWDASRRRVRLGPPRGRHHMLYKAGVSVGALSIVEPPLGAAAKAVAKLLVRRRLREGAPNLVHGTFYARHVFDLGDGPGVIDWHQFGQGPIEIDAGMFLATLSRLALRHESVAGEAARAREAFLERTRGLVDPRILEWYWAAGLLHLAASGVKTGQKREVVPEALAVVVEAARHAKAAASRSQDPAGRRTVLARIRSAFHARSQSPALRATAGSVEEERLDRRPGPEAGRRE